MAGAIGDYVHFHAQNYIKWGINRVGNTGSSAGEAAAFAQAQKDKLQKSASIPSSGLTIEERADLQKRLTWLMNPPSDSKYDPDPYDEIWKMLLPFFENEFGDAVQRIERATANVLAGVKIDDFKKIRIEKDQKAVKVETIQNRLDAINQAILKAKAKNGGYTKAEVAVLKKVVDNLKQQGQKFIQEVNGQFQYIGVPGKIDLDSDGRNFISAINAAAAASSGTANLQKGTLFEYMIAVAPLIGKNASMDAVRKAIEGVVGTSGKTEVKFDPTHFASEADMGSILGSYYQKTNDNLYQSYHKTQDKVDVKLILESGHTAKVSAKNVNLSGFNSRGVHIVSGMSLLSGFDSVENPGLVTHYLNQHSFTSAGLSFYSKSSYSNIYDSSSEALKLSLIYKALIGYKTTADTADLFIINDNLTGQVRVFDMSSLYDKILKYGIAQSCMEMTPDISLIKIANLWNQGSYAARITNILRQIHNYKLTIALSPSLFMAD